ncbi:MAG: nickel-responsive transcriptional regulator NikR [Candidatus Aminicenantes bacterium]|nr:nickel-responsive transcriptional regulator NikR [Candidatus Aminicenantes bacterium]NIM77312.1 nickel-responsive transcriptional regulator NikR [Candidatus Aminicenantes bacterium]NIN16613.1 nickel-responsive transcriptional regulator NikR [Candidatus Aminicenantes bacterium]NIN40471.1 nickel-responsive transcriptional regulator NikR [Candidatus Aminicenantes bacterium]NIN83291.1 nickel-responsive transcriptional regulator NikR [Candidatus Aminicenantes bacterium]
MSKVTRFGVSLETSLLEKFDQLNRRAGYKNRSEAIRDLIREKLVSEEWRTSDQETVGVFSLVYDHHQRDLNKTLNNIQHRYLEVIISSTHIHIDHYNCLEVIILKGKVDIIKKITDELTSTRGVKHGKLITTSTGSNID